MRYIENLELREWVKDNLRKTIFQKAHALAIQTGCEILVKLQDVSATTANQYYATGPLQKAYNNDTFRKQPDEKVVSGQTGLPLEDQGVQSDFPSDDAAMGTMPEVGDFAAEFLANQSGASEGEMTEDSAVPLHLSLVETEEDKTHVDTSTYTDSQTLQFDESDTNNATSDMQIKLEPIDDPDAEGIETKPLAEGDHVEDQTIFASPQEIGSTGGSPMFANQPLGGGSSSKSRYPVPLSPKPYQCGVCKKAFRSVQVLQKHTQTFHMRPQVKTPRRGRGRGSYHLNRPSHQSPVSSYSVFPGGTPTQQQQQQTPTTLQDIPGTSSQQMAHMAQMASTHFVQPQSTPMVVTPSTSDFSQSPSGPIFHSPSPSGSLQQGQSPGRMQKNATSPGRAPVPGQMIMRCILLSKGPITTQNTLRNNFTKLRHITKEEFVEGSKQLETANLGSLVSVPASKGSRPSTIFLKKSPVEVENILEMMPGLCLIQEYSERFHMPIPAIISFKLKAQLLNLRLVSEKQLR